MEICSQLPAEQEVEEQIIASLTACVAKFAVVGERLGREERDRLLCS